MELYGVEVKHKAFGRGKITEFKENCVTVLFDESKTEKKFAYPSAFGAFLELDNQTLLEQVEEDKNVIAQLEADKKRISGYQEKLTLSLKEMSEEANRLKKIKTKAMSKVSKTPKAVSKKKGESAK